jgi:CRP-like cAMP-binding protein
MFNTILLQEKETVIYVFHETLDKVDVDGVINYIITKGISTRTKYSIFDIRKLTDKTIEHQIMEYASQQMKQNNFPGNRLIALYTNTPDQVVLSHIFEDSIKNQPFSVKIFSTFEALADWINIPDFSEKEYEDIISRVQE